MNAKRIIAKSLADVTNIGLELGVGYLYFFKFKNVHPAIKIAVLLVVNRLTVNTINAITEQIKTLREDAIKFLY